MEIQSKGREECRAALDFRRHSANPAGAQALAGLRVVSVRPAGLRPTGALISASASVSNPCLEDLDMANDLVQRLADSPVVCRGRRVITLRMMDELHQRPEGTARRNFNEHRERLVESDDFFELTQPDEIRTVGLAREDGSTAERVILLTESGYLLLVKSFRDGLAWEVQRALVNCYFSVRDAGSGDVLLDSLRSLVLLRESQLVLERRTRETAQVAGEAKQIAQAALDTFSSNHGYYSVLGFARLKGWEMPVEESARHGKKLTALCRSMGREVHQVSDPRFGLVNVYPESILQAYFDETGSN
jgi:ORF6N domain